MRLEKINDSQVRCFISKQDLSARNITTGELKYGSTETKALFREVLNQAREQYNFNRDNLPIMVEAIPVNKDELMVIISAVEDAEELDPHFAHFSDELQENGKESGGKLYAAVEENAPHVAVFRFEGIDAAIRFSKQIILFMGYSELYRGEAPHEFYMVITKPDMMQAKDFLLFLNQISEFGELAPDSPLLGARLQEHHTPVMKDAHRKLAKM